MNFLMPRANQQRTPEPPSVHEDMAQSSYVPKSVTSLEGLIVDHFPENPMVENHGRSNGILGKNTDVASDKDASVIVNHTDISDQDGGIIIPYKDLPDDWNHAPDICSLRYLDRSFVFPGEQVSVIACLPACNQETETITPFKVKAVMSKNGMQKGAEKQNGNTEDETNSVAVGEEVSPNDAVMNQNVKNLEKEKNDPAENVPDGESFLKTEDQRKQNETLLRRFNNSHFFVRVAEWGEPLWSKKGASQTASDSSEMGGQQSVRNETKNTAKNVAGLPAIIDRGNFDANVSGGVARDTVKCFSLSNGDIVVHLQVNIITGFLRDPVIEILQFEKYQDRNLFENHNNLVHLNHNPCGDLLKWLLPVDNTLPPPRALSSSPSGSGFGIGSTSHKKKPTHSVSSSSQLFSFSNFRSYSMSSLPQNVVPPRGPVIAQSSKPSFELDEVDHYSPQKAVKSQKKGIEELLSFRGVSLERERFSVCCGLEGIHIPGRRWRRKLDIIQPVEIHSYTANCNTDDLLCVQIKNVSPAHTPDIVVYIDAITLVLEEASKGGPPASLPIACIEAGDDHSLPNLALRRGEEHSFILKPASSMLKDLKTYGKRSKSSNLKPLLKTFDRKGSTLAVNQYAIMVSCCCNYSESRLFLKQTTNWRPHISRDLMISVACEMSGQYSGPNEHATKLPVQVLTLLASNLTPEDLTMTVLAPASFISPPSVTPINPYPTTTVPIVSENQKHNGDARSRLASLDGQLTPIADFVQTSGSGCAHLWMQSRVPLGCVPAQSTATIKLELLPLTDGIITLDSLKIAIKEKESLEPRWISSGVEQKTTLLAKSPEKYNREGFTVSCNLENAIFMYPFDKKEMLIVDESRGVKVLKLERKRLTRPYNLLGF